MKNRIKSLFVQRLQKVLPEEIAFRKKLGFIVPIRIWMADDRYNADVRRLFCERYRGKNSFMLKRYGLFLTSM